MALLPILTYPDTRLKERSSEITEFDDKLERLIQDMAETMYAAPGVGLAAVQVGVLKRMFLLDAKSNEEGSNLEVFINPEVITSSGDTVYEEGCLSLPDFSEEIKRKESVFVKYQSKTGETFQEEISGFRAIIFQHELDHLDGILATDKISSLKRGLYNRKRNKAVQHDKTTK